MLWVLWRHLKEDCRNGDPASNLMYIFFTEYVYGVCLNRQEYAGEPVTLPTTTSAQIKAVNSVGDEDALVCGL